MSKQNNSEKRPLSPHLQVYRLPYNAVLSILTRAVGIGLALTLMVVCGWFVAVVWKPEIYDQTMAFLDNPFTKYVFIAWAFSVFFYLGNGIRHVLFDLSIGVNQKAGAMTGHIVLILSVLLTFGLWQLSCGCWSGETIVQEVENATR